MIFLITSFTLLLVNCEKEIEYPAAPIHFAGNQEFGWSIATKNGQPFEASSFALRNRDEPNTFFTINFISYTDWSAMREAIFIGELYDKVGLRQVVEQDDDLENGRPVATYSTRSDDGDVLEDFYKIDPRQDNWIEITNIDTTSQVQTVSGRYNLHFKIYREKRNPLNPDHVRFTDGNSEVRFEQ
ncbi:MAG: hypothetical protein AAGJ93_13200 [Bacteroidota bacterium]